MKKYNVTVNGTAYEVTLEAVDASEVKASPAPAAAPAAAPAPTPAATPAAAPAASTIVSITVSTVVRNLFICRISLLVFLCSSIA